jgi:hypothetical protein
MPTADNAEGADGVQSGSGRGRLPGCAGIWGIPLEKGAILPWVFPVRRQGMGRGRNRGWMHGRAPPLCQPPHVMGYYGREWGFVNVRANFCRARYQDALGSVEGLPLEVAQGVELLVFGQAGARRRAMRVASVGSAPGRLGTPTRRWKWLDIRQ